MTTYAPLLALLVASSASAEGRLVVTAGGSLDLYRSTDGLRFLDEPEPSTFTESHVGPGLAVNVGIRVVDRLALGIRAGMTRTWVTEYEHRSMFDVTYHMTYTSFRLGVGAQVGVSDRAWLAPWIGVDDRERRENEYYEASDRRFAFGLDGGYDVFVDPRGHRLGAYAHVTLTRHHEMEDEFAPAREYFENDLFVGLGVAYRYR